VAARPLQVVSEVAPSYPRFTPLSPGRTALQVTLSDQTEELMRYAQALLGHALPSGDVAQLIHRAFEALVSKLERERLAKTSRARVSRGSDDPRCVPAAVKRAVLERDRGQCTFVAPNGDRCDARVRLEFDHIKPVARGGLATLENLRLRCRTHNQL